MCVWSSELSAFAHDQHNARVVPTHRSQQQFHLLLRNLDTPSASDTCAYYMSSES